MKDYQSYIYQTILLGLIIFNILKPFFSKDKSKIWSPITAISLTYAYYCLYPFWGGMIEKYEINEVENRGYLFHIAALVSYIGILLGFSLKTTFEMKNWNSSITYTHLGVVSILIFLIGFIGFTSVRGFHMTFVYEDTGKDLQVGGLTYYFMMMLDSMPFCAALMLLKVKNKKYLFLIPLLIIFIHFLWAGARWRIVVAIFAMLTTYYLYPRVNKVNVIFIALLGIVLYFSFSVMDKSRIRGQGIDMSAVKELKYNDIKDGAEECYSVYWFSMQCMNRLNYTGERIYFEPIMTAIFMPIPREYFPWKPDASYIHHMEAVTIGNTDGGAAYLNFIESYYSFGWIGVILFSLLLGFCSKLFWNNYCLNKSAIGAIAALGTWSGVCYVIISRGYLAASFTTYVIAICIPFWIIQLYNKLISK